MAEEPKQGIQMLSDRVLVQIPRSEGERRSRAGILIPATAQVGRRLAWAEVVAVGPHVRVIRIGDQVLFNPEDRFEVEVHGDEFLILRERDIHAVAAERVDDGTGLYLSPRTRNITFMAVGQPITATADELDQVRYNADGLVAAIVQESSTHQVLMMAWMNAETLAETLESGRTVFWSRSRQERWRKGDSSGERQWVREAYYDCDGDTLLFVVDQDGAGACHTGNHSCFFRAFGGGSAGGEPA